MMPSAIFPDLKDRSVLITGGGSGIGAALTEGFIRQGSRVAFVDIADDVSQALVERLDGEYGNRPLYLNTDLRDVEALRTAVAGAIAAHGPVTVLVNNAAWDDRHDIDDVTVEYWDKNQSINLRPQFFAAQAVAPGMRQSGGGSIVNFTSTSFMINQGNFPSYTAAKAGIIGLTKGLAGRLGPENIRVNAIAPGWVITERQRELWVTDDSLKSHIDKQVLKEEIQPGDMVGPCLFLASDAARMLTAQTLIVDGGYL
ncbi:SDR family NAD(P)-dependent oxidoreductase [Phyllobacterium myrsinacearum]|uniref:NAD(P)-dependent dehydrogenase (Short-subunit alcohol dehydrogenase family) n=1 Tax=Phyllobacterium myrsinacearum TaxID=28101 RepID=A0A839EP38_9HYPH|nr:SDR family oxidoreductase [Phyllobacterium myrsinacearum]MBA8879935.1 NAD(P)-dependent dehydrogenase (short-subunit alcohol dehydrogenase family) [Phyllobacterium myrsinacearum]